MRRPIHALLYGKMRNDFVRVAMVLTILNAALTGGFVIGGCSHHFRSVP